MDSELENQLKVYLLGIDSERQLIYCIKCQIVLSINYSRHVTEYHKIKMDKIFLGLILGRIIR